MHKLSAYSTQCWSMSPRFFFLIVAWYFIFWLHGTMHMFYVFFLQIYPMLLAHFFFLEHTNELLVYVLRIN
jgi:hypothetical protein